MAKQEILQVFMKSEIHKFMNAMDMTDSGTKVFGTFVNKSISKNDSTNFTVKDKQKMIQEFLSRDSIIFVRIGNRYGVRKGVMSLSNGKGFIFVPDLKDTLEKNKIKEITYGKERN